MQAIDYDSYLTDYSMGWCQATLRSLGQETPVPSGQFFINELETLPPWYERFVLAVRAEVANKATPDLELAPRPFIALRKELVKEICTAFNLSMEESGLISETGE